MPPDPIPATPPPSPGASAMQPSVAAASKVPNGQNLDSPGPMGSPTYSPPPRSHRGEPLMTPPPKLRHPDALSPHQDSGSGSAVNPIRVATPKGGVPTPKQLSPHYGPDRGRSPRNRVPETYSIADAKERIASRQRTGSRSPNGDDDNAKEPKDTSQGPAENSRRRLRGKSPAPVAAMQNTGHEMALAAPTTAPPPCPNPL